MAVRLSQANVGSNENGAVLMMSLQTRLGDLVRGMGGVVLFTIVTLATPLDCGLDPPVHRDENDEERSSSALKAHTLAQRDQKLVNPEVIGWDIQQAKTPNQSPLP